MKDLTPHTMVTQLVPGERKMFLIDTPDSSAAPVTTEVAVENKTVVKERVMGVCVAERAWLVGNDLRNATAISPVGDGVEYLHNYEGRPFNEADFKRATFTWLQKPTMADLIPDSVHGIEGRFLFVPHKDNKGGRDRAETLVELDGIKVRVVYFLHWLGDDYVMDAEQTARKEHPKPVAAEDEESRTEPEEIYCTETKYQYYVKLSQYGSLRLDWLNWPTVAVADLHQSALAETRATQITLDSNAAGHGWFIDTTPSDNSEFLPTADANIWIAKAGSSAAGKMDMLSVLLHEYGHSLGLDHSGDGRDFMGAALQPGQRRLPSEEQLKQMAQLLAQVKGGGSTPTLPNLPEAPFVAGVGLLALMRSRQTRYGTQYQYESGQVLPSALRPTTFATAVNNTLLNIAGLVFGVRSCLLALPSLT